MTKSTLNTTKRLLSLDAFRGFTIMGMIIVNTPGSWDFVYPPLRHAQWNGLTSTELVSLAWAILFTLLCYVPVWALYRKKIFLKI